VPLQNDINHAHRKLTPMPSLDSSKSECISICIEEKTPLQNSLEGKHLAQTADELQARGLFKQKSGDRLKQNLSDSLPKYYYHRYLISNEFAARLALL
jgi:hypothetical protein